MASDKYMNLVAVLPSGDSVPVRVRMRDTVRKVKQEIEILGNIPKPDQWLVYHGDTTRSLLDHLTASSQLRNGAYIHVHRREDQKVHLKIIQLGKNLEIVVDCYHTIGDVIESLNELEKTPEDTCTSLIYEGRRLELDWTLEDYNVPAEATMHCIVKLVRPGNIRDSGNYTVVQPRLQPTGEYGFEYEYLYVAGWPKVSYKWPYMGKFRDRQVIFNDLELQDFDPDDPKYGQELDITVLLPEGNSIVMAVKPKHTIKSLKEVIADEGIPASEQILEYRGNVLKEEFRVGNYRIAPGSVVKVTRAEKSGGMRLIVDAVPLELEVGRDYRIGEVKDLISKRTGWSMVVEKLVTESGTKLDDDKYLSDYDIRDNARLGILDDTFKRGRFVSTLDRRRKTLEVRSLDHGFSVPWPNSVQRLKEQIEGETRIAAEDLLLTVVQDDIQELDEEGLEELWQSEDPLVHFRLKSEEPKSFTCCVQ